MDFLGGLEFPTCPFPYIPPLLVATPSPLNSTLYIEIKHVNTQFTLSLLTFTYLFFGFYTAFHYNSIIILNRRNNHASLKNTYNSFYFVSLGVAFLLDDIRYLLFNSTNASLLGISSVLRRMSVLFQTSALLYQLKYRSSTNSLQDYLDNASNASSVIHSRASSTTPLLTQNAPTENDTKDSCFYKVIHTWNFYSYVTCSFSVVSILLAMHDDEIKPMYPVISLVCAIIQHIPVVYLAICISFNSQKTPHDSSDAIQNFGPSFSSKMILICSVFLDLLNWIEPSIVSRAFYWLAQQVQGDFAQNICIVPPWLWSVNSRLHHGWASWMDLYQWIGLLSSVLLFLFVKKEFDRNFKVISFLLISRFG
jgi:hypothetical protein